MLAWTWRLTLEAGCPVPDVFRILCNNGRGLAENRCDLTMPASLYDTVVR